MGKIITVLCCLAISFGCSRGRPISIELNIYIDPQMSFVPIEIKRKYRDEVDEYEKSIRKPDIISIFQGPPSPPDSIQANESLSIMVGNNEYPINSGNNKIVLIGKNNDEIQIKSPKVTYKISDVRDRNVINIKIGPGSDILSL